MYFDGKAIYRYLRRRHKLYKAINNHIHGTSPQSVNQTEHSQGNNYQLDQVRKSFSSTLSIFVEQDLDIFQALETLKLHQKILSRFIGEFLETIVFATQFQSGHKLAYVIIHLLMQIVYRFCRENSGVFKQAVIFLENLLMKTSEDQLFGLEWTIFYTDLFFYGFFFTTKTYLDTILPKFQFFIIDLIIKLPPVHEWNVFIPKRHLFKVKTSIENSINELIKKTKLTFQKLLSLADQIHSQIVHTKINSRSPPPKEPLINAQQQSLERQFTAMFEEYEITRSKLQFLEMDEGIKASRSLQKVIMQCEFYEPLFTLPDMLHQLYKKRSVPFMEIKRVKKSQMVSIFEDEAFLTQLRLCNSIQTAIDLSAYFIANLSTEANGEQLVEHIINECHYEANLDLIMKVVAQIACEYPEIGEHLNKKAHKIASQVKMNKKYLNLLCEGIKYGLIDSVIILDYVEKRIITEHTEMSVFEIIRESCNILQILGQSVYHESLKKNILMNKILDMIDQKIKDKKMSIEFSFNLKCVKNYLRRTNYLPAIINNSAGVLGNQTLSELTEDFNLQEHFDLILKRIKEILSKKANNKTEETYNKKRVLNYIFLSIQNKSNFLQVFYEASLVKEINHKQINDEIVLKCTQKIQSQVQWNIQEALKWSRFLGELYNYEILNRKRLAEILEGKLLFCSELCNQQNFQKTIKCIIEALNISKVYILESEISKDTNHHVVNFMIKLKLSVLKYLSTKEESNKGALDSIITEHELEQVLGYFSPVLVHRLKSVDEINLWTQKVRFSSPKDTLLSVNLYKMLQFYAKFEQIDSFDPTLLDGQNKNSTNRTYHQPDKTAKKILYKQKQQNLPTKPQLTQLTQQPKHPMSKIQQIEKQIEAINQNFRNQEKEQIPEEEKQIIKQEQQNLQRNLKEMMGITPQIEINSTFPSLNQSVLIKTKPFQIEADGNCFKKILKNPQGKKMKIIARKINSQKFN